MSNLSPETQRRILMVDDDVALRTMLGMVLAGEGYAVSHADNGHDAVFLHNQKPFDLVITELFLSEENGFKALMQLQRLPTPVKIIATAKENSTSTDLCLRMAKHLGAHSVLTKPIKPEQLLAVVRNVMTEPR
jgi:CheY-like chemotaxis protein